MSITIGHTIFLSGHAERFSAIANDATIKPGMLIERLSTGKVQKHSTAGGRAERMFARENDNRGNCSPFESTIDITTAYASADDVPYGVASRGTRVVAWLKAGVSYAEGDKLVSAGDGTLEKESGLASAGLEKDMVAVMDQALNLSASGAVAAQGIVRCI